MSRYSGFDEMTLDEWRKEEARPNTLLVEKPKRSALRRLLDWLFKREPK